MKHYAQPNGDINPFSSTHPTKWKKNLTRTTIISIGRASVDFPTNNRAARIENERLGANEHRSLCRGQLKVCSQHMNSTATSRLSCKHDAWLAAAKLGRSVLSQFVRGERFHKWAPAGFFAAGANLETTVPQFLCYVWTTNPSVAEKLAASLLNFSVTR